MNSLRIARAALRARPAAVRVPLQRRGYADAVPDKACFRPWPRRAFALLVRHQWLTIRADQAQLVAALPGTISPVISAPKPVVRESEVAREKRRRRD